MIVGPRIIFDKSFLQSLNSDLIDEMTLYFTATCPSTLISEIIADLKLPARRDGRIGVDLVRQLSIKMLGAYGAEPPPLRSLVVGDLHSQPLPMDGRTLPVMVGTPGVKSRAGGSQLIVSLIPQQTMWSRWAAGDFTTDDDAAATAWRAGIDATNLEIERDRWKPLAKQLGNPTTLEGVVAGVHRILTDRNPQTQADLVDVVLDVVRGDRAEKNSALRHFLMQPIGTPICDYAPFSAHVVRLYLCFAIGMARGLLGTRRTNTIDLQYLLYAPFCRVFVSGDKLHRSLWEAGAVVSEGDFVWGDDFREDLKERSGRRRAMSRDEWTAHRAIHGQWPEPLDGSVISALWERHCPEWPRGGATSPNVGKTIDEIDDPRLREIIALAREMHRE